MVPLSFLGYKLSTNFRTRHCNLQFLICNLYAQNPQWIVYTHQNSGLPSNNLSTIVIDRDNIKWIGTDKGLAKFDGSNWFIYDTNNSPVPNNIMFPLALDSNNNLWIGISFKGITKFDRNNWIFYDTLNSGLPSDAATSMCIDYKNTKWIGTNRGLAKFNDTNWVIYKTTNSGIPSNWVNAITIENNIKWIGTFDFNGGLGRFNDTNWTIYNDGNSGLPSNLINSVCMDLIHNTWIATQFGGLAKFNFYQNSWVIYNTNNSGIPENNLQIVYVAKNTKKWIGTYSTGLAKYNDSNWIVFNTSNSPIPSNTILYITQDRLSNLWITTSEGLAEFNESGIIGLHDMRNHISEVSNLYPNYPNPFNLITNIKFDISKPKFTNFIIYNIIGKKVYEFGSKYYAVGTHEINWNAENLPSGIYILKMVCGEFSKNIKLILLK